MEVKREQFDYYILRSDELPPVKDNKATIEIISPVLKDARYRWKGIYNKGGETIDFYMCDEDFKKDMFDEKIAFKSGMCIDCVLEIQRKMSELDVYKRQASVFLAIMEFLFHPDETFYTFASFLKTEMRNGTCS